MHISKQNVEFSSLVPARPHPVLVQASVLVEALTANMFDESDDRVFDKASIERLISADDGITPYIDAFDDYEVVGLLKWVVDDTDGARADTGYQSVTLGELLSIHGLFTKLARV